MRLSPTWWPVASLACGYVFPQDQEPLPVLLWPSLSSSLWENTWAHYFHGKGDSAIWQKLALFHAGVWSPLRITSKAHSSFYLCNSNIGLDGLRKKNQVKGGSLAVKSVWRGVSKLGMSWISAMLVTVTFNDLCSCHRDSLSNLSD